MFSNKLNSKCFLLLLICQFQKSSTFFWGPLGFSWGTRPTSAPATSSSGSTGNSSTTNINASVYIGNDVSTYTEGNYTYGTGVSYDNIYVDIGSNLARFLVPSNETENSTTGIYEDERFPGVQIISNVPGSFSVNESRKRRSQPVKRAAPQLVTPTSSIGDAIAEAFATLQQAVNNAISNGVQQIENVAADIQNLASVTTQSAQRIAINGLAEINTIMSNVTDGFSACAEAAGNLFIGPIRVAQNDAEKCISDKVNEALNITANTLASLQDALSGVEKIQAEIDACAALNNSNFLTEEFVRSSCYATVLLNIESETILLPLEITKRAAEAYNLVSTIRGYIIQCAAKMATDVALQILEAGSAIAKCLI